LIEGALLAQARIKAGAQLIEDQSELDHQTANFALHGLRLANFPFIV
jgi:hypothetical protein